MNDRGKWRERVRDIRASSTTWWWWWWWFNIYIYTYIYIHEFKSWTRLIAFHIPLIYLGKLWNQLFSCQLWVNCRVDLILLPWLGKTTLAEGKLLIQIRWSLLKNWLCVTSCPSGVIGKYKCLYCQPQTDCSLESQLFSVARYATCLKLRSVRNLTPDLSSISAKAKSIFVYVHEFGIVYRRAQFMRRALHLRVCGSRTSLAGLLNPLAGSFIFSSTDRLFCCIRTLQCG